MTESLKKNGAGENAPQSNTPASGNTPASEGGVPSEVKTPENKSSEGSPKAMELVLAIIGIIKSVIDLLKKGSKESEVLTQMQASNQNIPSETLQDIFKKTAAIFADTSKTPTPKSGDLPKDPIEEIAQALVKGLENKSSDPSKNPIEEIAQALAKLLEDSKAPKKRGDGEIDKNMATKAPEEKSSKTPQDDKVTEDKGGEKKPGPKQTPTKPVDAKNTEMSHVERLLQMRQVSNEKGGGVGRG